MQDVQQVTTPSRIGRRVAHGAINREIKLITSRHQVAVFAVAHYQFALQDPEPVPIGLCVPARIVDPRPGCQIDFDQLAPADLLRFRQAMSRAARDRWFAVTWGKPDLLR